MASRRGAAGEGRSQYSEGGAGPDSIISEKVRTLTWSTEMRARCQWETDGADAVEVEQKDEVESRASALFWRGRPGSRSEAGCEHTGTHLV